MLKTVRYAVLANALPQVAMCRILLRSNFSLVEEIVAGFYTMVGKPVRIHKWVLHIVHKDMVLLYLTLLDNRGLCTPHINEWMMRDPFIIGCTLLLLLS